MGREILLISESSSGLQACPAAQGCLSLPLALFLPEKFCLQPFLSSAELTAEPGGGKAEI